MDNLIQPTLLLKPFAQNGDKNDIPLVNNMITNPQLADLTHGFPEITSLRPAQGGLPPERKDFNALGYLTTTYDFFYQAGGVFTFNQTISDAIGGYPLNARLWYLDANGISMIVRSTIANNTNNFLTDSSCIGIAGSNKPWVVESFRGIQMNENYITNCVKEVPQNINVAIVSDTLVLRTGSKVCVPNGFEEDGTTKHFDEVVTEQDIVHGAWGASTNACFLVNPSLNRAWMMAQSNVFIGGSAPTTYEYMVWYDTATNVIKTTGDYGASWTGGWALPVSYVYADSVSFKIIKNVFDGFGFLGSIIFVLPKVKMLFPSGINQDGTLANTSYETDTVCMWNCDWSPNRCPLFFDANGRLPYPCSEYWVENYSSRQPTAGRYYSYYSPVQNKIFFTDNGGAWAQRVGCILGIVSADSNHKITDFEIKTVYRSADVNEVVLKEKIQYVSTLPASPEGDVLYLIPQ